MRVAVVGGSGFIGSFLVKRLLDEGYDVVSVDIIRCEVPGAEFHMADVCMLGQITRALSEVDVVFHLAGTTLNTARKNPYLAVQLDVFGTANVLEACVKNEVGKVLYASSFYIYDGISPERRVDEGDRSSIFDAEMFGVAKLMGERLVLEYSRKYGLKYVILRFGPVYGPHRRCSCVVCDFILEGLSGNPIVVWGEGRRKNQYTYVEDVVDGCIRALKAEDTIYNLISPDYISIRELAELLASKYSFHIEFDRSKKEGPSMPYISPKKTMEELGWRPRSFEEGIERTYEGFRGMLTERPEGP